MLRGEKERDMAKAKKESGSKTAGSNPNKKQAAKKAAPASDGIFVDTNLAAESAARLLAARVSTKAGCADALAQPESSMFKQLKGGLSKPAGQAMSNLLDKHGGPAQKKSPAPFGTGQQVGRNQTFGADVNRAGVPRRTGGG
jgi:hypothetical protein